MNRSQIKANSPLLIYSADDRVWLEYDHSDYHSCVDITGLDVEVEQLESREGPCWPDVLIEG